MQVNSISQLNPRFSAFRLQTNGPIPPKPDSATFELISGETGEDKAILRGLKTAGNMIWIKIEKSTLQYVQFPEDSSDRYVFVSPGDLEVVTCLRKALMDLPSNHPYRKLANEALTKQAEQIIQAGVRTTEAKRKVLTDLRNLLFYSDLEPAVEKAMKEPDNKEIWDRFRKKIIGITDLIRLLQL